ncbi:MULTISPECIES: ferritin-like protein [unclassified Streptomyces]|uniref:ferritin-like domain-containing protein n=1 Tax=unclassified Streptomyces TaxID=2593676 RepID=UPI001BEBDEC5|nr:MULTISPECIES: ferritin-like protein [unclassified Streptomyces]MBT2405525.1 ferritin-like protein [Streptomyces sp. ISL-21]MBT2607796.1 ferritin-like protein [Streptomyces sp. ISL-87]
MTTASETAVKAPARRNVPWIRAALQTAIELEHSTLPIYTSAMLSLEVQNYTSYNTIRSVLMEEMVHMAIAANMLAAIGGRPKIKHLDPKFPSHGLPGGVEPDLHIGLAKLSKPQLRNFMRLESPLFLLPEEYSHESFPTIGKLYSEIKDAIVDNADELRAAVKGGGVANQVGDNIGFKTIVPTAGVDPVDQLLEGINEILEQGEGATGGTIQAGAAFQHEESHYGKFAELWYGREYREPNPALELSPETEAVHFQGSKIDWPAVVNTLAVPLDGYEKVLAADPDGAEAEKELLQFDETYTGMMVHLDELWNGSMATQWPTFGDAVHHMVKFRVFSCFTFMRRQIPKSVIDDLPRLYPSEFGYLNTYTDLNQPVFYGPRFRNLAAVGQA